MILDEEERSVTNDNGRCFDDDRNYICYYDKERSRYTSAQWKGAGYYRMMEPAGTQLPEYAPGDYHCGTLYPGWLNGSHPDRSGEEVEMTVCVDGDRGNERDCYRKIDIKVTNCKGYYVYFLPELGSLARYCGANPN